MNLSVVIPSKTSSNLIPCVEAIRRNEGDIRIIVVDNGLTHRVAGCEYIDWFKPFVFAAACNAGIRAAGNDNVCLTNDDALLESPGGFRLLQRAAEENPEYGVVAATCNNVGNTNQWQRNIGLRGDPRMVCFVAVLIPQRTIQSVGLLDEEFTGYGFDDDSFCVRVRRASLKIGIHDGCYVDHGRLPSTYRSPGGPGGDLRHNEEVFRRKYGAGNREV